ncbi:uncharacterized protein LOC131246915 [Magnolia sinica]|uniref:uncharacterized protein LOC131246915 n=1 Tax=Magnolia sinica TaxID=86752 RepID=UPI00265B0D63|nr:uncharacterized protein LOC131246915 [Magnolia sinica]
MMVILLLGMPQLGRVQDLAIPNDILIYYKSHKEHEEHLRAVQETLKQNKLYAQFQKCDFWKEEVKILGHVVSKEGISMDLAKVAAIQDWKRPSSITKIVKAAQSIWENQSLPFGRLICKIAHNYGYRQQVNQLIPIRWIVENTLNNMKMGPKQCVARLEELGDEIEEETKVEEDREDEEQEETKAQDSDWEPLATHSERETLAKVVENQEYLKKKFKKMSHTLKALMCCVQDKGAPPPSPELED